MDIRRTIGMAAAVAALVAAQPASAQTSWSVSETVTDGAGNELTETANGQKLTDDGARMTMSLHCTARALPTGVGTGVRQCYFEGQNGIRFLADNDDSMPGPLDTVSLLVKDAPRQPYRACVEAAAFFSSSSTFLAAPLACSPYA